MIKPFWVSHDCRMTKLVWVPMCIRYSNPQDCHMTIPCVVQARAYGSQDGRLTEEMLSSCLEEMKAQHQQKEIWKK